MSCKKLCCTNMLVVGALGATQLSEQFHPTPEVLSSYPVVGMINIEHLFHSPLDSLEVQIYQFAICARLLKLRLALTAKIRLF